MENQNYEEVAQETEQKTVETIKIKFSRKLARAFTSKNGKDMVAISIPNEDSNDNGDYDAFKALVNEANDNGITVIVAAGNKNADASGYIPAGINGVITVGAVDSDGYKLSSSNYGEAVDYYVNAESTSQAAAVFAGKYIAGTTSDVATSYETETDR